jgi:hypothetical protein
VIKVNVGLILLLILALVSRNNLVLVLVGVIATVPVVVSSVKAAWQKK